jgi:hypothetical protein
MPNSCYPTRRALLLRRIAALFRIVRMPSLGANKYLIGHEKDVTQKQHPTNFGGPFLHQKAAIRLLGCRRPFIGAQAEMCTARLAHFLGTK